MLPRAVRRLPGCSYEGARLYFLTILTKQRRRRFTDAAVVHACNVQILRAAGLTKFEIVTSTYMPDHIHLLIEGQTNAAKLSAFVKMAKQLSAFHVKRQFGFVLWAKGYYDRVVRHDEDVQRYVKYIRENPVKAGLVSRPEDYPFTTDNQLARPSGRASPKSPDAGTI